MKNKSIVVVALVANIMCALFTPVIIKHQQQRTLARRALLNVGAAPSVPSAVAEHAATEQTNVSHVRPFIVSPKPKTSADRQEAKPVNSTPPPSRAHHAKAPIQYPTARLAFD